MAVCVKNGVAGMVLAARLSVWSASSPALFAEKPLDPQMGPCGLRFLESWLSGSPVLTAMTECVAFLMLLIQHDDMWVTASLTCKIVADCQISTLKEFSFTKLFFLFGNSIYCTVAQWHGS